MASSTPVTSPITPTEASKSSYFSSAIPAPKPSSSHGKTGGLSLSSFSLHRSHHNENTSGKAAGKSASNSRNGSTSSLSLMMKGKGKTRKESISNPTPLASPFDVEKTKGDSNRQTEASDGI